MSVHIFVNNTAYLRIIIPGSEDYWCRAHGVTSTTISLNAYYTLPFTGTYNVELIPYTYYSYLTSPTSPSGAGGYFETIDTNVDNFDNIAISGGWTSETTQDGYTVFTTAGTNYASRYGTAAIQLLSLRGQELLMSNFDVVHTNGWIKDNSCSHALGDMRFVSVPTYSFWYF